MDVCPLKINSKNIECLGVNLQKEVFCNENLKSLKKEMEEDTENGEASHADGDKINIMKLTILPKAIYRFNVILIKILTAFLI